MPTTAHSDLKHFKNQLITKTRNSISVALMLNGKTALLNIPTEHYVQQHDPCITAELWPFSIQHAAIIFNTTKRRSRNYELSPWEQFTGERSKLDQTDMHPLFCPVYVLDRRMQEGTSPPKWKKRTTQKVYVGHLHHY
jgi:hypothetical protein